MNSIQKTLQAAKIDVNKFMTLNAKIERANVQRFESSVIQAEIIANAKKYFDANKSQFAPISKVDEFFLEAFGITKAYAYRLIKLHENADKLPEFRALCDADANAERSVNAFTRWLNKSDADEPTDATDATDAQKSDATAPQNYASDHIKVTIKRGVTLAEIDAAIAHLNSLK